MYLWPSSGGRSPDSYNSSQLVDHILLRPRFNVRKEEVDDVGQAEYEHRTKDETAQTGGSTRRGRLGREQT